MRKKKNMEIIKADFVDKLRKFVVSLGPYSSTDDGQWSIKGFIDVYKNVYTISADTKIVSKIIEIHLLPMILEFAKENGFAVVLTDYQNWYPDLSFVSHNDASIKFAVDIKTTYKDPAHPGHCNGFTLGSHGTYFINRDGKKNIQFPYKEYLAHLCIGIIYSRCDFNVKCPSGAYKVKELSPMAPSGRSHTSIGTIVNDLRSITSVVKDFQFFVREKWEIASDSSGSGNTANIGSITKIEDLVNGNGVFKNLGEKWFDDYWMNYGKIIIKESHGKSKRITHLEDFLRYKGKDPNLAFPRAQKLRGQGK